MEKTSKTLALVAAILIGLAVLGYYGLQRTPSSATPGTSVTPGAQDLIVVTGPQRGAEVSGTFDVVGSARGTYFFEATFPVTVYDAQGKMLVQTYAQAEGEWMTESFVPFTSHVVLPEAYSGPVTVVLAKDNPSGLPENDFSITFPLTVRGTPAASSGPRVSGGCVISGCSAQICGEEEMVSTCEYREAYACYKTAKCERQATGKCGWSETAQLRQCLSVAN